MKRAATALAAAGVVLSGCVTTPAVETASDTPVTAAPAAPVAMPETRLDAALSPIEALEQVHRGRAQAYAGAGNWADALVQWEVLALLQPDSREYREAIMETRARIAKIAAGFMQSAEQARKQGNLDQAEVYYLRVLNVDRENAAAAQALRDLDADRTKRAYTNRAPRIRM